MLLVTMMVAIGLETHEEILVIIYCTNASPYVEREVALSLSWLWLDVVSVTKIRG